MKVGEFLNLLSPKGFKIIAGESALDKKITGINMMENPDTIKWLKEGELLITSGYLLKDGVEIQKKFIKELSEVKASGIGIKNNRYIEVISEEVIDVANEYDIPIIVIPYEYTLSDVSNMFYKEIYNRQSSIIQKSLYIHETLTNIVLNGGSIKEVTKEVASLIGNPIIVFDEHSSLLTHQFPHFEQHGINISAGERDKLLKGAFIKEVKNEAMQSNKSIKYLYKIGDRETVLRIKQIIADKKLFGYIVVPELVKKLESIDYRAIERASEVIVLEMIKYKAIEETKHLIRRDFFDDLLEGKINSEKEIESLGSIHGLMAKFYYTCMVIEIIPKDLKLQGYYHEKALMLNLKEGILHILEEVAADEKVKLVSILRGRYVICFIPIDSAVSGKKVKEFTLEFGDSLEEKVSQRLSRYDLVVGIGKSYPILNLSKSFKEAMEAIKIISQFGGAKKVVHFEDFMIFHLLNSGMDKNILTDFYKNSIEKLVIYDAGNNTNLVETLETYFKCKGNMSEAAKLMFIHRNTFIYRIEKVKEILNTELENGEELLELQLGIRIMKLLEVYKD